MSNESQDAVAAIEEAMLLMRRDHMLGHFRGGPGERGQGRDGQGHDGPPWGTGRPPWGDGPPPAWMRGHHGPRDRSLGGAARFRLLDALLAASEKGQRLSISEIADAVKVDQPRASRLVNDAAERGLVTRRPDERDARRIVVELSDAGRTMLESTRATRRSAVTEALSGFTPEEVATLASLLGRFVAAWPR